ncbi:hypothetical protein D3C86_1041040 [compost metagenome]
MVSLPAASRSTSMKVFRPAASGVSTWKVHWPFSPMVARPSSWVPVASFTITVTVWPGVPLLMPLSSGRVSSVVPPEITLPVTPPTLSVKPLTFSRLASGGVTSISKLKAGEGVPSLPLSSRVTMVMACWPSSRSVEGVKVHVPSSATSVVPISLPLSRMTMVSPGVPRPPNSGWRSSVTPPWAMLPRMSPASSAALPT